MTVSGHKVKVSIDRRPARRRRGRASRSQHPLADLKKMKEKNKLTNRMP